MKKSEIHLSKIIFESYILDFVIYFVYYVHLTIENFGSFF